MAPTNFTGMPNDILIDGSNCLRRYTCGAGRTQSTIAITSAIEEIWSKHD